MKVNGLILAAGMSKRMKDFKPLLKIEGKPLIQHTIDSLLGGGVQQVVIVLGYKGDEVIEVIRGYNDMSKIILVRNPFYETTDMLDSIKYGIKNMPTCDSFFLLPGDMPFVDHNTINKITVHMEGKESLVTFPTVGGRKKHPPLISYKLIERILKFEKEGGLRVLWEEIDKETDKFEVEDLGCILDLDTKEDYRIALSLINQ